MMIHLMKLHYHSKNKVSYIVLYIKKKKKGNKLLKQGFKKHYKDIIESYTRGLEQKITEEKIKLDLLNNR